MSLCFVCGADVDRDQGSLTLGWLTMQPYGRCFFHGREVRLTASEAAVLWALLKAQGRIVSLSVLAGRIDYDGDGNCVAVLLSRIRGKLRRFGPPPIESVRGVGWRLIDTFPGD